MKASGGPQKLRFTVHSFSGEIATRVEVFVGAPPNVLDTDPNNCVFKRLGYLSFDSNERSNHQARELKSVHVNVQAFLVRLVIHRCHVNKLNIYNQASPAASATRPGGTAAWVGIIALNLIGEQAAPPPEAPSGFLQLHPPVQSAQPYYNAAAADVADVNLDLHVDTVTAMKIRELARQKDEAVAREDYDTAKALKASIERLKVVGQKIAQLEARKRAAVEKEDYDTAKLIKADIDKLRAAGEGAAMAAGGGGGGGGGARNADEVFNRVLGQRPSVSGGNGGGGGQLSLPFDEQPVGRPSSGAPLRPSSSLARGGGAGSQPASPGPGPGPGPTIEEVDDEYGGVRSSQSGLGGMGNNRSVAKDAEGLEELAGGYVARAFFSKNWQLRDAAVAWLTKEVSGGGFEGKRDAFRNLVRVAVRGMKDKVANVYLSCLALLPAMVDSGLGGGGRDAESMAEAVLPLLIDKLGDNNARLREASKESIMLLASIKDVALAAHTGIFVKPIKNQSAWRPVLGILQLLRDLVPLMGISSTGEGFELNALMEFVGKAYNSANADVRSEAVRVTKEVFDLVGPAIRKCMPKDINPKIKEQAELEAREAELGPDHPDVAESCSNLAILYNQRGDCDRALPLYERALAIYENLYGKDHPEVAHTLTDIAVLHLEQGREDIGRPLLERALTIQEKALGPDHPDVLAIKDVLNSE
ncbi:hypothetical protein GPECTOR_518g498 [Gonium pectorale]|uniref:TOG domain-containing protein n=1 Tax=Gonium pectorale TaxID=33097 RepID=A0A150FUW2_GONPE|nr:hypothetical protein GPECTOR_518g498 [Gonium pectorale]|eukprot:KXZ41368.1 hypothetical protein GPECTOR_518g498 [Gonium pectorale]